MSPVRAQPVVSYADDDDALVYTTRDLNQQTARIMSRIEQTGKPAFITRHGRFVAVIRPLSPGQVESRIIAEAAREFAERAAAGVRHRSPVLSAGR